MGSATIQGRLWGARAHDYANYLEQVGLPLMGAALDAAHVRPGTQLLDAGCGAGLLALLAFLRGAKVSALDASPALLEIARDAGTRPVRGGVRHGGGAVAPAQAEALELEPTHGGGGRAPRLHRHPARRPRPRRVARDARAPVAGRRPRGTAGGLGKNFGDTIRNSCPGSPA